MFAPILDNTGTHLRFDETESFPPWIEYLLDSLLTILSQGIATFIKDVASCRTPIKLRELDTANAAVISVLQDYAKVIADNSVCVARQQKKHQIVVEAGIRPECNPRGHDRRQQQQQEPQHRQQQQFRQQQR